MPERSKTGNPGTVGRVRDVQFMEVEFAAPVGTRMIIELEGGLRLLVADDRAVETAARFINFLNGHQSAHRKGGRA